MHFQGRIGEETAAYTVSFQLESTILLERHTAAPEAMFTLPPYFTSRCDDASLWHISQNDHNLSVGLL